MKELPPGLRARRQSSGALYFYLKTVATRKELPLGRDREAALNAWRDHMLTQFLDGCTPVYILTILESFRLAEIPLRNPQLRPTLHRQIAALENFFNLAGNPALISPWPNIDEYYRFRGSRFEIRAGAEVRLFVHIWGWAQRLSLVRKELVCRWSSDPVRARTRQDVLREVGAALLCIACHNGLTSPEDSPSTKQLAPCVQSHGDPTAGSTTHAALSSMPVYTTQTGIATHASIDDIVAQVFLRHAADQLTSDGRRDLAREVQQLPLNELQTVLRLAREPIGDLQDGGTLVLGTRRSVRLGALKRNGMTKKPQESALTSTGAKTTRVKKPSDKR